MYRYGRGVSKDDKAAVRQFLCAQKIGNKDGTLAVIEAFRNGIGVEKSAANRSVANHYEKEL